MLKLLFLTMILFLVACNTTEYDSQELGNDLQEQETTSDTSVEKLDDEPPQETVIDVENDYIPFDPSAPIRRMDNHEFIQVELIELTSETGGFYFFGYSGYAYTFRDYFNADGELSFSLQKYEQGQWVRMGEDFGILDWFVVFGDNEYPAERNYFWTGYEGLEEGLIPGTYRLTQPVSRLLEPFAGEDDPIEVTDSFEIIIEFDY